MTQNPPPNQNNNVQELFDQLKHHLKKSAEILVVLNQKVGPSKGMHELMQVKELLDQAGGIINNYLEWNSQIDW